jgi:hypothetical protein
MVSSPFGSDIVFSVFPVIFIVMFVAILGVILFAVVKSVARSATNRNAPILSVDARVVGKREETGGGMGDMAAWTNYYATFEVASGDRMEFQVEGRECGLLAEGDEGKLTFQGTRYVSFQRFVKEN